MSGTLETLLSTISRPTCGRYGVALCLCFSLLLASGCASNVSLPKFDRADSVERQWIDSVITYPQQLPVDHPDVVTDLFVVSDAMREQVMQELAGLSGHGAARRLARWLIDEEGWGMKYDVKASLTPQEAWREKRGNCLSFTMLMVSLAAELGLEIHYNSVDIPDTWDMDESLGMIFYRHVNGVLYANGRRQVFDLAMDVYDAGYPQRFIQQHQVTAMLFNNRSVAALEAGDAEGALHNIKMAIAHDSGNADYWANLGVIKKRDGNWRQAEIAFLYGVQKDRRSLVAASNLERLYRELGRPGRADDFARMADRARLSNPYVHYQQALAAYESGAYRQAEKSNNRAITMHNTDPRFYELRSLIAQQRGYYRRAIKSLARAYEVSTGDEQRGKYASKAELVSQHAVNEADKRRAEQRRTGLRDVDLRPGGGIYP